MCFDEYHFFHSICNPTKNESIKSFIFWFVAGMTSWIHKWKRNGWTLSTGKPVINKEELEELDSELSSSVNVKWVGLLVQNCTSMSPSK